MRCRTQVRLDAELVAEMRAVCAPLRLDPVEEIERLIGAKVEQLRPEAVRRLNGQR